MSTKKSIINKDRFKNLSQISEFDTDIKKQDNTPKSRFDIEFYTGSTDNIDINKLEPAPDSWNFYKPLPDEKFLELTQSIEKNSLLHPVVLWEREDSYMILSGHNRVKAYKKLYEITKDEKYAKIPAIVKRKDEIDENTAREIIVDTNWIQRQLTTYEKTQSILQKYVKIKKAKNKGEKTRDLIATELGISGRMVQNYLSLNQLEPKFFTLIDDNIINIKTAVLLSKFSPKIQDEILKNYEKISFDTELIKKAQKFDKIDDIMKILIKSKDEKEESITLNLKVPKSKKSEFMKIYKDWLNNL